MKANNIFFSLLLLLLCMPPILSDFGAIGSSSLGWLADEIETTESSFVDSSVYDFDVNFPMGKIDLGMKLGSNLTVLSLDDSKAADLTGLIQIGDTLLSISGVSCETLSLNTVTAKLKKLQEETSWFWLTFRPSRLEKREKSVLYDQNVTIRLKEGDDDDDDEEDEEESIRLGLMLNSALKVHGIVEGSPLWMDGRVKQGDLLVSIGGDIVTGQSLSTVGEILQSVTGSLTLRFRLSLEERRQIKRNEMKNEVNKENKHEEITSNAAVNSTYTIVFDTLQDLGIVVDDEEISVIGFTAGRSGNPSPAEQTGEIILGDIVVSVDGEEIFDASRVRNLFSQKTHQEVLKCRGGKVTRYCSIERIEPETTKRVVIFRRGPDHYRRTIIRRDSNGGNSKRGVNNNLNKIGSKSKNNHLNGAASTDHDEEDDGSYYLEARKKAKLQRRTSTTVLMPSGQYEPIFRSTRGAAHGTVIGEHSSLDGGGTSDQISLDWSNSLFGGPLPCHPHNVIISLPLDGCSGLKNPDNEVRNSYVIVRRGGCFFSSKAINAQYAGAAGLIVIDHPKRDIHGKLVGGSSSQRRSTIEKKSSVLSSSSVSSSSGSSSNTHRIMSESLPERMPANPEDGHLVKIPAIAINYAAGERLLNILRMGMAEGKPKNKMKKSKLQLLLTPEDGDDNQCPDAPQSLPRDGDYVKELDNTAESKSTSSSQGSSSSNTRSLIQAGTTREL
jgi:hypothetical protein